jgi:hypothetical protein
VPGFNLLDIDLVTFSSAYLPFQRMGSGLLVLQSAGNIDIISPMEKVELRMVTVGLAL